MIIDPFGIDDNDMKMVDRLLIDGPLNFYYNPSSTTPRFPFMCHVLAGRPPEDHGHITLEMSQYYQVFYSIFQKFLDRHGMICNRVLRAAINCTVPDDRYEYLDPHVDNNRVHFVCIMYLNDLSTDDKSGATLIFNEQFPYDYQQEVFDVADPETKDKFTIEHEIVPKKGAIICFSGNKFHTIRPPKNGDYRFIAIWNFI